MFKKQTKNYIHKIIKSKNIIIFVFLMVFFIDFSFSFEISLKDSIEKIQNTIKRNSEISIGWKAIIDDIYKTSLNKIQIDNITPLLIATDKTAEKINKDYTCTMNNQEIIEILYFTNASFKHELKNNLEDFKNPTKDRIWINCNKLNTCIYKDNLAPWQVFKNTVSSNKSCQNIVENIFLTFYIDSYYNGNIWEQIRWTDTFWNNDLSDSNYDLLNDIFKLGTILFQDIKSPAKILFYSMPKINYNNIYQEPKLNMKIDWFSPYNIFYGDEGGNNTNSGNTWDTSQINSWDNLWNNLWNNLPIINEWMQNWWISWEIESSIKNFINSVNINLNNPSSSFVGNQCVSGFESEKYMISFSTADWENTQTTPQEYLESVIEEIEDLNCNNDSICQDRESDSCPDCQSSSYDPEDPSSFEEIQAILENIIEQWEEIPEDDPVLGCVQKCDLMPCGATECPKLVCYAKCFCQIYSFDTDDLDLTSDNTNITWLNKPIRSIGLSSKFAIKFCIIPAIWWEVQTKTIYSITSIFSELNNILENLKNSGNMWINIKPKEFLEHTKKEYNFAKQISFNINSAKEPVSSNQSKDWMSKEQINLNTDLMEQILWFSKEYNTDKEQNKYILIDDPCEHKVIVQASNRDEKEALLESCRQESNMNPTVNNANLNPAMINQNIMLINIEFDDFMEKNRDFWYETKLMFDALKNTAQSLENKK